jgi:cyanophycin synthetase
MKVLETRVYRGPNLYGYRPIIRLTVDLEELEDYPSDAIPGFVDKLVHFIPSLQDHTCSYGVKGGFVRRLREGTWMGHILEHCSLELQCLAGTPVTYGKCRSTGDRGVYHVIYSYDEERVGLKASEIARKLLLSLLPAELPSAYTEPFDFHAERDALARLAERIALGPSTRSLVEEAKKRGIPALRLNDQSLVQFGYGRHQKRIQATVTSETRHIAVEIAQDKELTNRLLHDAGLPVPKSVLVDEEDEAVSAAEDMGYPVVLKPYNLSHGRGVAIDLRDAAAVRDAFRKCAELTDTMLVERFLPGRDHRVLVIQNEVVAVAERVPGHVVGDGTSTIGQLVERTNQDPRRGVGHENLLTRIEIDYQAERLLALAGRTLDSVLAAGEVFYLRSTGNLSTGGTAVDRTDVIHPDNAEIAVRAAAVIGLDIAGIDLMAPDISKPVRETGGGIVEVNAAPGFRMHIAPTEGRPRNVAGPVLDMLFPPGSQARIPILAITGTNGKTTTSRLVAHILKMSGKRVGLTTTDGIYIDGQRFLKGDMTGPWSARVVLRDPTVDAAVMETARGGILREGLGFDRCDVGCVLNVGNDHLGLRGVGTLEELAYVKRLVLEVVRKDGVSVMNADDPLVVAMATEAEGQHLYFTMNPKNELVREHIGNGGLAAVLEDGANGQMLTLYRGEQHLPLLWSHLIPATLEGKAMFNVANALAAAAVASAAGVSLDAIRQGLRTFDTTFFQAPGRCNVYDQHPFRVIVDYGHNPPAVAAMVDLVKRLRKKRAIGVLSAPGDRRDQDIRELGATAAPAFDTLILREDDWKRGREPGQIVALLEEGVRSVRPDADLRVVLEEQQATDTALKLAEPGDLVVLFADEITRTWKQVIYFGREEVTAEVEG